MVSDLDVPDLDITTDLTKFVPDNFVLTLTFAGLLTDPDDDPEALKAV